MEEKNLIRVIEKVNLDYLNVLNSKEYNIGKKIAGLKKMNILKIFEKIKRKIVLRNIKENKQEENWTEKEKEVLLNTELGNKKIVIYSCITGNYDNGKEPYYKSNNIDYIMYTSNDVSGWTRKEIPDKIKKLNNPILINRYLKFHPHELFEEKYDYSIYIDGNIEIISDLSVLTSLVNNKYGFAFHRHYSRNCAYDEAKFCIAYKKGNSKKIKEQMKKYETEKFPKNYGLLEGNVIVNDLKNERARNIMEQIWNELNIAQTFRDQLTIPYVLWKNNIETKEISTLGKNVYKNPKIRIERHN